MTPAEQSCLAAIKRLTIGKVTPSYDQLTAALGLASKSGVHRLVHSLVRQGYIRLNAGKSHNIRVVRPITVEVSRLVEEYGLEAIRRELDKVASA